MACTVCLVMLIEEVRTHESTGNTHSLHVDTFIMLLLKGMWCQSSFEILDGISPDFPSGGSPGRLMFLTIPFR